MKERGGRRVAWMRPWPGVREDGGKTELVIFRMDWEWGSWAETVERYRSGERVRSEEEERKQRGANRGNSYLHRIAGWMNL